MSSVRRNNQDSSIPEHEQQRIANMAEIKKRLESLKIPHMNTLVPPRQPSKRRKKIDQTSDAATEGHNLRSRSRRNNIETVDEQISHDLDHETNGDFLCDNEDLEPQKKKGRGISRLDDIFSRTPDMPKIKIMLNEYGQPVGENSRRLAGAIGIQVRRTLPLGCDDWRLVDAKKKLEVWENIKEVYDIGDAAFKWFMTTCGLKWKGFKAELKEKFFDETLTDKELMGRNGGRVNPNDWKYLINFWRSDESKARTERAKACRAKLQLLHTSGSVSHASTRHKLGEELGRPARRDEVFVKTHTRKNGVPSRQAAPKIDEIKDILEVYPELVDRTIQQGDAYAIVCGLKEPKGRVRVLGVGPTPQDIGTPELKSYVPTRIQMEVLAHEKAESERAALQQRVKELEEQMLEERLARERQNHESNSQHGSTSRHQVNPRPEEAADESHQNNSRAEAGNCTDNEDYDLSDGEKLLIQKHATAPLVPAMNNASQPCVDDGHRYAHDSLVGKTVILYAMLRSQAVARGVVISTNPNTILGGQPLGKQFCEVIVNVVLKRDAMLPRPYDDMETMADADMMSIAWPYKRKSQGAAN